MPSIKYLHVTNRHWTKLIQESFIIHHQWEKNNHLTRVCSQLSCGFPKENKMMWTFKSSWTVLLPVHQVALQSCRGSLKSVTRSSPSTAALWTASCTMMPGKLSKPPVKDPTHFSSASWTPDCMENPLVLVVVVVVLVLGEGHCETTLWSRVWTETRTSKFLFYTGFLMDLIWFCVLSCFMCFTNRSKWMDHWLLWCSELNHDYLRQEVQFVYIRFTLKRF